MHFYYCYCVCSPYVALSWTPQLHIGLYRPCFITLRFHVGYDGSPSIFSHFPNLLWLELKLWKVVQLCSCFLCVFGGCFLSTPCSFKSSQIFLSYFFFFGAKIGVTTDCMLSTKTFHNCNHNILTNVWYSIEVLCIKTW